VTEQSGIDHLKSEGVPDERVFFTGNIMIDSLVDHLEIAGRSDILDRLALEPRGYVTMTMHRPSNVDRREDLQGLMTCVGTISRMLPVVFPCHPRTRERLEEFGLEESGDGQLKIIEPLGYLEFLKLQSESRVVLTDSGGIQEETTYLGIPCVTMRENTERPVTVDVGTNTICGTDPSRILSAVEKAISGQGKQGQIPKLWDGRAAHRIVKVLRDRL